MKARVHDIDPTGDTLLILRNPNAPFLEPASSTGPPQKRPKLGSAVREQEVQMRLSSQRLVSASAYFKSLIEGNWKETTAGGQYSCTIDTTDFDEEALLILMNIIHGKTVKLPLSVSFETLAKISVLADYYQCRDTVQFFVKTWLQNMDKGIPTGRDALYSLCISWLFPDAKSFKLATATLIRESKETFDDLGLPISQPAIDALNERREARLSAVLAAFNRLVKEESASKGFICSPACSSMYLGALIKNLAQLNLLDPTPQPPYTGHSMSSLEDMIRKMEQLPFEKFCPRKTVNKSTACGALYKLRSIVDQQYSSIEGLELKKFITK
ncbi:hypothetical protein TgHK011_000270 [Trichoderma gracile]|nr:hypothetical protein TgHK011_000270 [Trichoderma gracile]